MAVSILTSGGTGALAAVSTLTIPLTFSAGSGNRKLLVALAFENSSALTISSIVINGQDLVALGLQVSGTQEYPDSFGFSAIWEQFEAGLPSSGSSNIVITLSGAAQDASAFAWLVDGVNLGQLATGAGNDVLGAGTSGTTISTTITAGDTGALLVAAHYQNNTTGTASLSAPASSTTDADNTGIGAGGCRMSFGHKLGSLTAGTNTATWTQTSSQARRTISAAVVNTKPPGESITAAGFSSGAASASATASTSHAATAAFSSDAASASATASTTHQATAVFASGAASFSAHATDFNTLTFPGLLQQSSSGGTTATVSHILASAAAFISGAASASATANVSNTAVSSAAFVSGPASSATTATRSHTATATFASGPASSATSAHYTHPASQAAFASGPASASATLVDSQITVLANFVSGPASSATTATITHEVTAAFASGPASSATTATSTHKATAAAFASGVASFSAHATDSQKTIRAAFVSGPASSSTHATVTNTAVAAFISGPAHFLAFLGATHFQPKRSNAFGGVSSATPHSATAGVEPHGAAAGAGHAVATAIKHP